MAAYPNCTETGIEPAAKRPKLSPDLQPQTLTTNALVSQISLTQHEKDIFSFLLAVLNFYCPSFNILR